LAGIFRGPAAGALGGLILIGHFGPFRAICAI